MNSDDIVNLPTKQTSENYIHPHLTEFLQKTEDDDEKEGTFSSEMKQLVILTLLFGLLASTVLDRFIIKAMPVCANPSTLLATKALLFAFIYYIIQNSKFLEK
jgi:hypothetical protein